MNTIVIAPEVLTFVAAVRAQLDDLEPDELVEITDGLEADLVDLVAERGTGALGDPVAYAAELRAAAGLGPAPARRGSVGVSERLQQLLDAVRTRWDRGLAAAPGDLDGILAALQPVWWVARAWIGVQVGALVFGSFALHVVPDQSPLGALAVVAAVIGSIQLGRHKIFSAARLRAAVSLRVLVIAVNVFAVAMLPAIAGGLGHARTNLTDRAYNAGSEQATADARAAYAPSSSDRAGMYVDGKWVSQIYPYDANGHPLVGVQLFNQTGKPLNIKTGTECVYDADEQPIDGGRVYYPWSDGAQSRSNVFPVPNRVQQGNDLDADASAFSAKVRPSVNGFPFVTVPKISLPGLSVSTSSTPRGALVPGLRSGPVNQVDDGC